MTARPDEVSLVERARAGAEDALTALYQAYADMVFGVAFRITRSQDDAADVVQDVFIGLPEALRKYEERGNIEGWLKRVAALTALLRERRRKRMYEVHSRVAMRQPPLTRPGDIARRLDLESAMEQVPDEWRTVFLLKEVEGFSHAEIGDLLGISSGASQMRLLRARRLLMELLEDSR